MNAISVRSLVVTVLLNLSSALGLADEFTANDLQKTQAVFQKYCSGCHNPQADDSDILLTSLEQVRQAKSAEKLLIVPGKAELSHLMQIVSGRAEPAMPPAGEPQPSAQDIDLIGRWIASGARLPEPNTAPLMDKGEAKLSASRTLATAAVAINSQQLALGGYGKVRLVTLDSPEQEQTLQGFAGKITSLRKSLDGKMLIVGSGRAGLEGEISLIDLQSLALVKKFVGHSDLVYTAALSPDGRWLASGSYDRKVNLWNVHTGALAYQLTGHNGAIYDLDFHPQGSILATASSDQTVKLWNIADGARLDTLGQPEGEMRCVRFSADGSLLFAAGSDRQVRQWQVDPNSKSGSPMLLARFAHERDVLRMEWFGTDHLLTASADGTVKLWSRNDLFPLGELIQTKALPIGLCNLSPEKLLVVDLHAEIQVIDSQKLAALIGSRRQDLQTHNQGHATKVTNSSSLAELIKIDEAEPNNRLGEAQKINLPAEIRGTVESATGNSSNPNPDAVAGGDLFQFVARAGEPWVVEVFAAQEKSPLDSLVDILDSSGQAVLQTRLQALRESYFTFRGKDSATSDDFRMHKWEDMELDEFLFSSGEVTRLWLYPRGPDSGFKVYPGAESRHTFFGTTAVAHALGEPAYIVRELAESEQALPNGLPIFPIYFENDDDPLRERGADSRLTFRAPADGRYLLRIRDARGFGGDDFKYRLVIRQPAPNFELTIGSQELTVVKGSGSEWNVKCQRIDGLQSAISITLHGLPAGVVATNPLVIEAGQRVAFGTIWAGPEATVTSEPLPIRLTASTVAEPGVTPIEKELPKTIGLKISDSPITHIALLPQGSADTEITELTIRPGQTISARLRVDRNEVTGSVPFGNEDSGRNLPHGSFVDNIGLNGLLIVEGQDEREFFITAAPKVKPGRYQFHFRSLVKGNPTSKPIWLNVLP